jgi:hypothetical protein
MYPFFIELSPVHTSNSVRKGLARDYGATYPKEFLGVDNKSNRLWFGFNTANDRNQFRMAAHLVFRASLRLKTEDSEVTSRHLSICHDGKKFKLLPNY